MGHNWILDVLSDLRAFAQTNDLPVLADQLGEATLVAAAEIASTQQGAPLLAPGVRVDRRFEPSEVAVRDHT